MIYNIGSFNVKNLNYTTENVDGRKITRSFETIAQIIRKEEFSVIALQEVLSLGAVEQIKRRLGDNWKVCWEQPPPQKAGNMGDKRGEGYAYIWDSNKLDLICVNKDDETRKFLPRIWHQYVKRGNPLVREPYYARFSPVGKIGGSSFEIRLINTHIVYGGNTQDGINLRKEEFLKIVENVYQNVANKRYGINMPAYVVVLGDYNLSLQQLPDKPKIKVGNSQSPCREEFIITKQDEPTTINHQKQDDNTYCSNYVSSYDHFSFIEAYEKIMNIKIDRINPQKYCKSLVEYWETVSDHVPIKMEINLNNRY